MLFKKDILVWKQIKIYKFFCIGNKLNNININVIFVLIFRYIRGFLVSSLMVIILCKKEKKIKIFFFEVDNVV